MSPVRSQYRPGASTDLRTFFGTGKSAKNPCRSLIRRTRRERKKLLKPVLGVNLEDLPHAELECQRSAETALLNSVLGKTLEDDAHHHDHPELECQLSAQQCAAGAKSRTRQSAHPPTEIQEQNGRRHIILEVRGVHKLVLHLRHKSIGNLHGRADVGKMLHGVPLNPSVQPRLPDQLRHALVAHREVLRAGPALAGFCPRGA